MWRRGYLSHPGGVQSSSESGGGHTRWGEQCAGTPGVPGTPHGGCGWSGTMACPAAEAPRPGAAHPVISGVLGTTEGLQVELVSSFCFPDKDPSQPGVSALLYYVYTPHAPQPPHGSDETPTQGLDSAASTASSRVVPQPRSQNFFVDSGHHLLVTTLPFWGLGTRDFTTQIAGSLGPCWGRGWKERR